MERYGECRFQAVCEFNEFSNSVIAEISAMTSLIYYLKARISPSINVARRQYRSGLFIGDWTFANNPTLLFSCGLIELLETASNIRSVLGRTRDYLVAHAEHLLASLPCSVEKTSVRRQLETVLAKVNSVDVCALDFEELIRNYLMQKPKSYH